MKGSCNYDIKLVQFCLYWKINEWDDSALFYVKIILLLSLIVLTNHLPRIHFLKVFSGKLSENKHIQSTNDCFYDSVIKTADLVATFNRAMLFSFFKNESTWHQSCPKFLGICRKWQKSVRNDMKVVENVKYYSKKI